MGVLPPSTPFCPPSPLTQAGKSRLEGSEAHPADDGLSGRAEDMGFVENIQHGSLVERLQVVPGERDELHPGSVPGRRPEERGHHTCASPASAGAWRTSAGSTAPASRCSRLRRSKGKRLGQGCAHPQQRDFMVKIAALRGCMDVILSRAPCLGFPLYPFAIQGCPRQASTGETVKGKGKDRERD